MSKKTYLINEIFLSLQGEGIRAGTANIFVRFTGCNLKCDIEAGPLSPGGFACDTEFTSGIRMSAEEILLRAKELSPNCRSVIFTGGEPLLQLDIELITQFRSYACCVETNGTIDPTPLILDWVTLSPKVAEHAIKVKHCNEIKYVRAYGQGIPKTEVKAQHYLVSPAFEGSALDKKTLDWCIKLVKDNPQWRLSIQQHKAWSVR